MLSILRRNLKALSACSIIGVSVLLASCGSTSKQEVRKPVERPQSAGILQQLWSVSAGSMSALLRPTWSGEAFCTISQSGQVNLVNAEGGVHAASFALPADGSEFTAGAGCDFQVVAAVRGDGELIVSNNGGEILWQKNLKTRVLAAPLLHNGYLFVLTFDGQMQAYTAKKGNLVWQYTPPSENIVRVPLDSMPIASDEKIILGLGSGRLVVLDEYSGLLQWESVIAFDTDARSVLRISDVTTPAAARGRVCAGVFERSVACFRADSGALLWQANVSSAAPVGMDAQGELLLVSDTDGTVHAFNARNGSPLWTRYTGDRNLTAPIHIDGVVIVGGELGGLHVLSAKSGEYADYLPISGNRILNIYPMREGSGRSTDIYGLSLEGTLFRARLTL